KARFQHAAAPDRNIVVASDVMDGDGLTEAAHAPNLYIDDAAGAQFKRGTSIAASVNGFIKADAGFELPLELGVEIKVVVPKGLLDHEQPELVELPEVLNLLQRISGIGVAAQKNGRPALADAAENINVPARFAFDLDAAIAGVQLGLNFFQQLFHRVLNADGDAAGNLSLRAAQQAPQRHLPFLRFSVPESVLKRAFGHAVSANFPQKGGSVSGLFNIASEQGRREVAFNGVPRRI